MNALTDFLSGELDRAVPSEVEQAGRVIAGRLGGVAVLFYGSVLRTGDLDGLLDFYVLRDGRSRNAVTRLLWPDVSYHEVNVGGTIVRAKVAAMPLETFARAAQGGTLDTTVWARFVQPAALVWTKNPGFRQKTLDAVAEAAMTAARFAALHGPEQGDAIDFWRGLFRATYAAELRVEAPGREDQILGFDQARYRKLLPLAWQEAGIAFEQVGEELSPRLPEPGIIALASVWLRLERAGKRLNLARLMKAAFTFDGATRYAAWKIERHTGMQVMVTPFRERHPIMAAPGVLWQLWRHTVLR
ncbi:hypothetical protein SAMN05428950_1029 [Sphingomonas sp. OV641]|uniref:hypothetical protein n=1 Tax=Sphingomonas sp. OV641 TaxID=1881068 RepID=UPI0008D1C182|nr:hypothetical protein [Sphingomonas sp. OV641]SEJ56063.1 hypothetical protein SAMN05428950_1029 [Sphingomonas sp. OV641]